MRLDGPVILIQSVTDPGDIGEPREFWDDDEKATCVVVPSFDLWRTNPRSLRPIRGRLIQGEPGVHDDQPGWSDDKASDAFDVEREKMREELP